MLHHTGDLDRALRQSAALVVRRGVFAFALYRRVWMDWFWRIEKPWYAHATPKKQRWARSVHGVLFRMGLVAQGRRFVDYVAQYNKQRGMDFDHDVHDWLGGWPYESISAAEVAAVMSGLGFAPEYILARKGSWLGRDTGFLGSGCDEYVYRRA